MYMICLSASVRSQPSLCNEMLDRPSSSVSRDLLSREHLSISLCNCVVACICTDRSYLKSPQNCTNHQLRLTPDYTPYNSCGEILLSCSPYGDPVALAADPITGRFHLAINSSLFMVKYFSTRFIAALSDALTDSFGGGGGGVWVGN